MSGVRLNRRLTLEREAAVPDGAGGRSAAWAALGTIWGEMTPRSGRETAIETGTLSRAGYRVKVRALPEGHGARPRAGDRFRTGTRLFDIRAVQEAGPAARYLICTVEEEVTP
ncbi:head-tail adaptor [Roseivivax lentus]|uniref:Head-tail adaptor n=1 Tax=Roseivivax lentus TaxID=633194 RepID=A0A1N7L3V0_9RHOB|nr:head-tail adaptor protein [Roseivivax lentus]SIS68545.1 head-tail adaptor [Roseivivax lentus]